ncbi:MAG: hypothetical protein U0572_09305 [Phycisphaerales bacterium]
MFSSRSSHAEERLWLAPIGGAFTDAARWLNGVPGPNDVAVFGATPGARPFVVTLDGTNGVAGFVVTNQSPHFTASGSQLPALFVGPTSIGGAIEASPHVVIDHTYLFAYSTLEVGAANTTGSLTLGPGSTAWPTVVRVGADGGVGSLALDGATIDLSGATARLVVGDGGNGALSVAGTLIGEAGATIVIGANGGNGDASFEPGSIVAIAGDGLAIGGDGAGPLAPGIGHAMFDGATIESTVRVGVEGTGTATFLGDSTLTKALVIGTNGGAGAGLVQGSLAVGSALRVASAGTGSIAASGIASLVTAPTLYVGTSADGTLTADSGATIAAGTMYLGENANGHAIVDLSSGAFLVTSGEMYAPATSLASASLTARDSGTTIVCAGGLHVGHGPTTISVRDGATLSTGHVSPFFGGVATIDVRDLGTIACDGAFTLTWPGDAHIYQHVLSLGPRGTVTCGTFDIGSECVARWRMPTTDDRVAPCSVTATATIACRIELTFDEGYAPPHGTLIPLLDAATVADQAPIVVADLVHGFPPILLSEPTRLSALAIDHVDALGPAQIELWEGMRQRASVTALVDGVAYDIARQAQWTFSAPELVSVGSGGWMTANASGITLGALSFGAASRAVPIIVHPRAAMPFDVVNENAAGVYGNAASFMALNPALSADGRFVLFETASTNLLPIDATSDKDVYLKDVATGALEIMSVDTDGAASNVDAFADSMSADACFVSLSSAADLAPNSTPGTSAKNVFLRNRVAGTIEAIDVGWRGSASNGGSGSSIVSSDGRFVAFQSSATNLVAGPAPHSTNVYLRDRLAHGTSRIDPPISQPWDQGVSLRGMTPDARYVLFTCGASTNLWRRDLTTGVDVVALPSVQGNLYVAKARIADDGRHVVLQVTGSGSLGEVAVSGVPVIVLYDIESGELVPVSMDANGAWIDLVGSPWVSADARYVTFAARSAQLPPYDATTWHAYRRDMTTGAIDVVDCLGANVPIGASSGTIALSADGSRALFNNDGPSFAINDVNSANDLFVRTLPSLSADLDGDGVVGPNDLALLLGAWGTPSADLDTDGTTGPSDLSTLLASWSA